jgi:hypothetical protein
MDARELISVLDYKVWGATFGTIFLGIANISLLLTALASLVSIGYTVYQWYLLWKKNKK